MNATGQKVPNWGDYLRDLRLEEEQINILQWTMSEDAGEDVGRYAAEWRWYTTERAKWIATLKR